MQLRTPFFLLIVTVGGLSSNVTKDKSQTKKPFELNEFLKGTFSAKSFNGSWLTENSFLYKNNIGDNLIFNLKTKTSTLFLKKEVLNDYPEASFVTSANELYILIRYSVSAVFRHSTTALYSIYDIGNKVFYDVAEKNHIQVAQWSPVGHGLLYVYQNNMYYLESPFSIPKVLTSNGNASIYNGVPDWVYEEEVLASGKAFWFSPNGKQVAFASFDDTHVKDFAYFIYGNPGDINDQYPKEIDIKYPKVNTPNPIVKTYIADLETDKNSIEVNQFDALCVTSLNDYIFYGLTWITDDELAMLYTNRVQNEGELVRCATVGICSVEATYKSNNGWLLAMIPIYNKNGTERIEILPQPEEDDYFNHIVITDTETGVVKRLTEGRFVVSSIYGWDLIENVVYFVGSRENQPSQRHIYAVNVVDKKLNCLTCEMKTPEGTCKYASASFSRDFSYYVKVCQGSDPYWVEIHSTKNESDILLWEDNQSVRDELSLKLLPKIKDLKVNVGNGFKANVRLLLPPNLDETSTKTYPAIVNVYAGPNSNQIKDSYTPGFQNYIVTNREYIYIYIDGRGSGNDGFNKMFQIYRKFATVEIQDQISVTKYLQETFPYIDANNTGIWGWSYGGFATAWVLVQDVENVFKCGLSVAPVTNFIYYDSIYTERYMGLSTQDDNELGYNNTDVTRRVEALRGKLFFLIHGNADDNVHYQQSMLLSKALETADIPFRQQSYPDENHGLGHVYPHLYHTIDRFWARSFNLPDPPAPPLT